MAKNLKDWEKKNQTISVSVGDAVLQKIKGDALVRNVSVSALMGHIIDCYIQGKKANLTGVGPGKLAKTTGLGLGMPTEVERGQKGV